MRKQQFVVRHLSRTANGMFRPNVRRIPVVSKPSPPVHKPSPPVAATVPVVATATTVVVPSIQPITSTTINLQSNIDNPVINGELKVTSPDQIGSTAELEKKLALLRKTDFIADIEKYMNDKSSVCFIGLAFKYPDIQINKDFTAPCLWCKQYFEIPRSALHCKIFRHAYERVGHSDWRLGAMINPHASEKTIEHLKKNNLILGCGGAMYYDGQIVKAVGFDT